MEKSNKTILITGATGFIGNHLVERIKDNFNIYAISRRRPKNPDFFKNENIKWIQADIAEKKALESAFKQMDPEFSVDFVIHLAGFYDFNYDHNPEYQRTNIEGTKNVLELCRSLNLERFIFASSVAACEFPRPDGKKIHEKTPADASFDYAISKNEGEKMTREYAQYFKTSVARFGAAFSDWCEYGPLYIFLSTWLNKNWKSHILAGKGKSAIPYIHINCLVNLLLEIIEKSNALPNFDTYIASSSMSASHKELFDISTRFFYGESRRPLHIPKWFASFGVWAMYLLGRMSRKMPFERPWMMRYIDKQMLVDNSYTREILGWQPTRRYVIQRRLLFIIEHMKSYPFEWQKRNAVTLKLRNVSPNFIIYEALDRLRDSIIEKSVNYILNENNYQQFPGYHTVDKSVLKKDTATLFQFLSIAVRSNERMSVIQYAREIAKIRAKQNLNPQEVLEAVKAIGTIVQEELGNEKSLKGMHQEIYDDINLTFQIMLDEIEGTFETILRNKTAKAQLVFNGK